ncbi:MAG: hypothetical protein IPG81_18060 [Sandaracinaceae bacterium]|nr:hypothetical protein [Sandaracinaceae bacterium]
MTRRRGQVDARRFAVVEDVDLGESNGDLARGVGRPHPDEYGRFTAFWTVGNAQPMADSPTILRAISKSPAGNV